MTYRPIYPADYPIWIDKRDNLDLVEASHVNILQAELDSTQRTIGRKIALSPDLSKAWYPQSGSGPASGNRFWSFTGANQPMDWPSLADRLANLEKAALRDLDFNYVSLWGGSVLTPDQNHHRPPNTGGIGVLVGKNDPQPAFSVMNTVTSDWAVNTVAGLWSDGAVTGTYLKLKRSVNSTLTIDPDTGIDLGSVRIAREHITIGSIVITADRNVDSLQQVKLSPSINPNGDSLYIKAGSGGVRNVLRVVGTGGDNRFLLDTDGNCTVYTLKVIKDTTDRSHLWCDGVYLDKNGLVFTWNGGSFRPGGAYLNGGGVLENHRVWFNNNQGIHAEGDALTATGRMFHVNGGVYARGMHAQFHHVAGVMYIWIPQVPGGPQAPYEPPCRSKNKSDRRDVRIGFNGPPTGMVKISWSVEIRAYSRPVYVSFGIQDMATGHLFFGPADSHACMNNGARSAKEQTDVDHVTTASFEVITGLTPGRPYNLIVYTRAADTGAGDVGKHWTQAQNMRVLIEPMMMSFGFGVVHG